MGNRWPDDGEKPLGPIERKVLPWLAWALCTSLPAYIITSLLVAVTPLTQQVAAWTGLMVAGALAAWAVRPWRS